MAGMELYLSSVKTPWLLAAHDKNSTRKEAGKAAFLARDKDAWILKFIYSEKATKCCEIFTLLLSYVVPVKSKVKI